MNRISTMDMRLVYKEAVDICRKANVDPDAAALTDSTLRLEQQLSTIKSQYTFPATVVSNGPAGTLFNTEIRLNQQDSFLAYQLNMFLAEPTSATDTTYTDYSYPSPAVFAATGPPTEATALETLYKGALRVTVNNVVKIPTLHLGRLIQVPQTQKATTPPPANDQRDGSTDGSILLSGLITFIGSKNNLIEIFLPAAIATIGTAGFTRVILEWRGLLAQNSTIIT